MLIGLKSQESRKLSRRGGMLILINRFFFPPVSSVCLFLINKWIFKTRPKMEISNDKCSNKLYVSLKKKQKNSYILEFCVNNKTKWIVEMTLKHHLNSLLLKYKFILTYYDHMSKLCLHTSKDWVRMLNTIAVQFWWFVDFCVYFAFCF